MTMIYYFHKEPKAFSGGQLRLYALGSHASSSAYEEVEPRLDRAVFFPSWFPHEVLPIQCDTDMFANGRFAISCWVHKTSGKER
jgi:Rps23 Pro-64 3,4-dihydroxylase Tpa1-like proline 4-hydroxylase